MSININFDNGTRSLEVASGSHRRKFTQDWQSFWIIFLHIFPNFMFLFSPSSFSNKKILFTREITMTQKLNNFLSLDLSSWAPVYFTNVRFKYFRTFDWPLFVKLFLPLLYKVKSFNPCLLSHAVILNSIYYNLKVY